METIRVKKLYPPRLKEVTSQPNPDYLIGGTREFILYDADTGKFIAHYFPNFVDGQIYGNFFNKLKYNESLRVSGLKSKSQIFGFAPRDHLKNLPTRRCQFDVKNPKAGAILQSLSGEIAHLFNVYHPELYHNQLETVAKTVSPIWRFDNLPFTSGIINMDTAYLYHTDNGNMENCYSGMITLKNGIEGGSLHLPEYNAEINLKSGSLLIFDGASVSHGVTPFKKGGGKETYRITIVWYALENLKHGLPTVKEELKFFNDKQLNKTKVGYHAKNNKR